MEWIPLSVGVPVVFIAFCAEFVDSTLGMGYGTALTPILLLMGLPVEHVVPAVLMSELVTGALAGFTHHRVGNADLAPRTLRIRQIARLVREHGVAESARRVLPKSLRVALVLGGCSIVGSAVAATIATALPKSFIRMYIAVLIVAMGLLVLLTRKRQREFSWRRIIGLGALASFNKGISGGGYGPVVTAGQLTSGVDGKSAVAVTSVSEALSCLAGTAIYLAAGRVGALPLALYMVVGATLSVPLSAFAVRAIRATSFVTIIGIATLGLGLYSLANLVFF
jgi:uncharacterized membrane protein YfcA